jgi:hypothetical protein
MKQLIKLNQKERKFWAFIVLSMKDSFWVEICQPDID